MEFNEMFNALKILIISYVGLYSAVILFVPDKRTSLERRLDNLTEAIKNRRY